jgi:hypothetical protein
LTKDLDIVSGLILTLMPFRICSKETLLSGRLILLQPPK